MRYSGAALRLLHPKNPNGEYDRPPSVAGRPIAGRSVLALVVAVGFLGVIAGLGRFLRAAEAPASAGAKAVGQPVLPVVARPLPAQPPVGLAADRHLDKTPPRRTIGLDLIRNGWTYNCMECHTLIAAKWHYDRPVNEHQDIKLDHGNNRFCLNCHHPANRNVFVDYDGAEIAERDVVQLCAKCHGTTHRDWQAGVHGRQNGFWKADSGEKTRLRCIQCHDPHRPKFQAMKPLAPLRYPARAANPPSTRTAGSPVPH
jgi:hypothetical protein